MDFIISGPYAHCITYLSYITHKDAIKLAQYKSFAGLLVEDRLDYDDISE